MLRSLTGFVAATLCCGAAPAGGLKLVPITAGSGINSSYVQIDFDNDTSDGDTFLFEVFWNSAPTGFEMLETLESEVGLTLGAEFFDFDGDGKFTDALVTELGFGGNSHTATSSEFWTYWMRDDSAGAWAISSVGVSDRIAAPGSWDGWTFGEFGQYVPREVTVVPTQGGLAVIACATVCARRRRRSD